MPSNLVETLYCSEQIHIPPTFPWIMKLYCKAAIKTQPYDLLKWSASYFRAMANGEVPPVKERLEYPPYDTPTGLTPGYLKVLIKQLGKDPSTKMTAQTLFIKWNGVCLQEEGLVKILALLGARTTFSWLKFVAVAAGTLTNTLTQTMILLCELLTEEPEGGMATVPLDIFSELYTYLAYLNCGPLTPEEQEAFDTWLVEEDLEVVAERIRAGGYQPEKEEVLGEDMEGVHEESAKESESVMSELPGEDYGEVNGDVAQPEESIAKEVESLEDAGEVETETEAAESKEESVEEKGETEELAGEEGEQEMEVDSQKDDEVVEVEAQPSQATMGDEPELPASEVKVIQEALDKTSATSDMSEEDLGGEAEESTKGIDLADLDEAVRKEIEAKLAEEEESSESEADFEQLGSCLLQQADRAGKFTADEIGYRMFKKYLRQDVSGIGSYIDKDQVEKVLDFMDYWSHKQEHMVMPRNIRHWMCPPLDKVEPQLPEPVYNLVAVKKPCKPRPNASPSPGVPETFHRPCAAAAYRRPCPKKAPKPLPTISSRPKPEPCQPPPPFLNST